MPDFGMLAHHANGQLINYVGWFASRKLNGWRCLWDGFTRGKKLGDIPWYKGALKLVPSTGLWTLGRYSGPQPVYAPDWFLDNFPVNIPLDGELWHPSDRIEFVKSIAGQKRDKGIVDSRWESLQYLIYNCKPYALWNRRPDPFLSGDFETFWTPNASWAARMYLLQATLTPNQFVSFLEQEKIKDEEHLKSILVHSQMKKYEGVMLINPASQYELKRSRNLLKIKGSYETEAEIASYIPGKGRHTGRMGAITCVMSWDEKVSSVHGGRPEFVGKLVSFNIGGGFSDQQREWDFVQQYFPIGGKINFSYLCVSDSGTPISCNFTGDSK